MIQDRNARLSAAELVRAAGACGRGASANDADGQTARDSGKNTHQSENQYIFH